MDDGVLGGVVPPAGVRGAVRVTSMPGMLGRDGGGKDTGASGSIAAGSGVGASNTIDGARGGGNALPASRSRSRGPAGRGAALVALGAGDAVADEGFTALGVGGLTASMLGIERGPCDSANGSGAANGALGVGIAGPKPLGALGGEPFGGASRSMSSAIGAKGAFAGRGASGLDAAGNGADIEGSEAAGAGNGADGDGSAAPPSAGSEPPNEGSDAPTGEGSDAPIAGLGNAAPAGDGSEAPAGDGSDAPAGDGSAAPEGMGSPGPKGSSRSEPAFGVGSNSESVADGAGRSSNENRLAPDFTAGSDAPPAGAGSAAPPTGLGKLAVDGAGFGAAIVALPSGITKIDDPHLGHRARMPALGIRRSSVSKLAWQLGQRT